MKTDRRRRWGLGIAVFPQAESARGALSDLSRAGLRRAIIVRKSPEGRVSTTQQGLTERGLAILGGVFGLAAGLLETGASLFPPEVPDLAQSLWITAFTLLGAAAGWVASRLSGGSVDRKIVEQYARWVLRDEVLLLVQVPRSEMHTALAILRGAGRGPATFMVRPRPEEPPNAEPPILFRERMTSERLREHAASLAHAQRVSKPRGRKRRYLRQLRESSLLLRRARQDLGDAARLEQAISPSAEWLLDNAYVVEGLVAEVIRNLPRRFYEVLPVLAGSRGEEPRVHRLAYELVMSQEAQIERQVLAEFLSAYQEVSPLTMGELWAFPLMLRRKLVEALSRVAVLVSRRQFEREEADFWANRLLHAARREPEDLLFVLSELAREVPSPAPHFAVRLTGHLHDEASALLPVENWLERKLGISLDEVVQQEKSRQARHQVLIANAITSMRELSKLDWKEVFVEVCHVEKALQEDPLGIYPRMDFATSDQYRHAVEEISRYSRSSELEVTARVLELAREARDDDRQRHVGYYLADRGRERLEGLVGTAPPARSRFIRWIRRHHSGVYLGSLAALTVGIGAGICLAGLAAGADGAVAAAIGLLALIPASELAIQAVNYAVTRILPPSPLPKMRFKTGIPEDLKTIVVVPVILEGRTGIEAEVERLEVRYLANNDANFSFGLLSDFPDAPAERMPDDDLFLETAIQAIERLNARYPGSRFFLFHRERRWSECEGQWMGWERKRGKIEQLNRLLCGERSPELLAMLRTGDPSALEGVRFVITLDADTQLPPGTARRMVETLAHPLNTPRLSPDGRAVVEGYTIIQPRVSTSLPSANATTFSRLFTDASGTDPYTHMISDVYQDLTGEGSYHGKGIYDARMFHRVLTGRFPETTLLSHDLLEGVHARVGYASDIELLDQFPSTYVSCSARDHRWIRGDWQIIDWLFPRVPGPGGKRERNPLSGMGRWKILDNLRRSLVSIGMLVFLLAGWTLPAPFPWVAAALVFAALAFPVFLNIFTWATTFPPGPPPGWRDLRRGLARALITACLLPHEAMVSADAIIRVFHRKLVSRKRLLEWRTAQMAQSISHHHFRTFLVTVGLAGCAAALAGAILVRGNAAIAAAIPFLCAWALSPAAAWALSLPPRRWSRAPLEPPDRALLREVARQTWRYFDDFVNAETNWLPPDNFQEELRVEVALRTSPTNIGLWLLSALSARDLGYITTDELIERCSLSVEKLLGLEKYEGHLLNWYDIRTLEPLRPRYISTVDTGNLLASLWAFDQGLEDALSASIIDGSLLRGLSDSAGLLGGSTHLDPALGTTCREAAARLAETLAPPRSPPEGAGPAPGGLEDLLGRVRRAAGLVDGFTAAAAGASPGHDLSYWAGKVRREVLAWNETADMYLSWAEALLGPAPAASAALGEKLEALRRSILADPISLRALARGDLPAAALLEDLRSEAGDSETAEWLDAAAEGLARARSLASRRIARAEELLSRTRSLADGMNLRCLYDEAKKLFVIGMDVGERRRDNSYYDLLASEARLASFVAIAGGQAPLEHWMALSRPVGSVGGRRVLLSWSGSMFEYIMPLLLQRSYPGSLLEHACRSAVERQIEYGERRGIPWGISESAYSGLDLNRIYQYRAFGVPGLGLKRGLEEDLVVAPYATALALAVVPHAAAENLRKLTGLGLRGRYGFYEAIDYTRQSRRDGDRGVIVYAYLSHHQGMSLIALDNVLNDGIHIRRFHADPRVRAVVPLLYERVPVAPSILTPSVEERSLLRLSSIVTSPAMSRYDSPFTPIPSTHLLSNGSYAIMVTNSGGGYSRWRDMDITRWRADTTRDSRGSFVYVKDLEAWILWSSAYQPVRRLGRRYHAHFAADRAEFRRRDGDIETLTEIVVSADDDAEIRRVTIINRSQRWRGIELTSYAELVLAPHAAERSHPAFSKLFIQTEALPEKGALLAWRRPRSPDEPVMWAAHLSSLREPDPRPFEFETDRARFLGRGRGLESAVALDRALSGSSGHVLDPIFSIRRRFKIEPGGRAQVSFVTLAAESREKALTLIEKYKHFQACDRAIDVAWVHAQLEFRYLGIQPDDGRRFQQLASHLLYPNATLRPPAQRLRQNVLGQPRLWAHGISGDLPIMVVTVSDTNDLSLVRELLLAHRYWKERGLKVDLVILDAEAAGYEQPLHQQLLKLIQVHSLRMGINQPGGVFLRAVEQLPEDDVTLILAAARAALVAARGSLAHQLGSVAEPVERGPVPPPREIPPLEIREAPTAYPPLGLPEMDLRLGNGTGGFSGDGREYVISLRPGLETPAPWVNVLAGPDFGALVSESGAGFVWCGNSQSNRLIPWSNDPVLDPASDALYIRDEDTGEYWTPTPCPIRGAEAYRVRHGQGYSVFEHGSHGLRQELTVFVPVDEKGGTPVRVGRLRIENASDRVRRISVTSYAEWTLGTDREETQLHIFPSWDPEAGALLARNSYQQPYGQRVSFAALSPEASSYTSDRAEFLGIRGSLARPAALDKESLSGRTHAGLDSCAALQTGLTLEPGEATEVLILLGQAIDVHDARRIVRKLSDPRRVEEALRQTRSFWDRMLGAVVVETPDPSVDVLLNRWLLYQTLSCRIWGRSGFYQSGGAFGFRDQLQDVLALLHTAPAMARDHILKAASRQFLEGDVEHWWHPPSGAGVRTRCSDDLLWLPYAVLVYTRSTGDEAILEARAGFLDGRPLGEEEMEAFFTPSPTLEDATIFEHCRRAIERSHQLGPHGLPKIGSGDWNDGFNRVGTEGSGESVWLAWFQVEVLRGFAELAEKRGEQALAARWRDRAGALVEAVELTAWDGEWYTRGYYDDGAPLGSKDCEEARIDSLPQSWAAISGAGDPQRARQALESVEKHLIREEDGLILLFTPPFDASAVDPGYIKAYPPGIRENGGQYTHAAIWVAMAFARLGDGSRAADILRRLNPIGRARTPEDCARYRVEPYVVAADVYSLPGRQGQGGWTWYTGSSGWMYRVWLEEILGVRVSGATLEVRPCIPPEWESYSVRLRWKSSAYEITVQNPDRVSRGVGWVDVDGERIEGLTVPLEDDGLRHEVRVVLREVVEAAPPEAEAASRPEAPVESPGKAALKPM